MPIAGIAGKAEYMDMISPRGPVQISGTNTGRYLSVSAALAVIEHLEDGTIYQHVANMESQLIKNMREIFNRHTIPCHIDGYGGRIGIHIGSSMRPRTMKDIEHSYPVKFAHELFRMLSTEYKLYGFLLPLTYCPEPVTLSALHTVEMIDSACDRLDSALTRLKYHDN